MRGFLADLALSIAKTFVRLSEEALSLPAKRACLEKSEFWGDVSAWIDGVETWSELRHLRARRQLRRDRLIDPDAPIRIQPKPPESGMGPGEATAWLLIWLGMPALAIGSFIVISPQAWIL